MCCQPQSSDLRADLGEVRGAIRKILARFDADYWRRLDADRAFPTDFMSIMADAGYFGTLIPERWGGLELGTGVASVIVEEINRAGGDAAVINAQMAICGTLLRDGTDEQRARYLPGICDGSIRLLTVAATEPDSGADMSRLKSLGH
ncbi:MAG: acyl-CoA dehydrogenase family protein, partial [Polyangiaceae bacterium]|nr:acyl-CoA dehydrogenase family protein [Polyangiaceae bacterium]